MLDRSNTDDPSRQAVAPHADVAIAGPSWRTRLDELLVGAAELCAEHGVDPESFMQAAWDACLDARPGLRELIADRALMARMTELRERGLVGEA